MEIRTQNTAIRRNGPSNPLKGLESSWDIKKEHHCIFDYGCGRGEDVKWLKDQGYYAIGWDPYHELDPIPNKNMLFDVVLCTYVLCVIPKLSERKEIFNDALDYVAPGGQLIITTRTQEEIDKEATKNNWTKHNDGWLTKAKTFQKGHTVTDLINLNRPVSFYWGQISAAYELRYSQLTIEKPIIETTMWVS